MPAPASVAAQHTAAGQSAPQGPDPEAPQAMEFRFRAGDRSPRRSASSSPSPSPSSARSSRPRDEHVAPQAGAAALYSPRPPLSPFEWEAAAAAARREWIIREEVERRLIEEGIGCEEGERRLIEEGISRELALARARLHGGSQPHPSLGPAPPFVPPPPAPFFGPDGPFILPMWPPPQPLPAAVGMHAPPPMPVGMHPGASRPAWSGPPRGAGFRQPRPLGRKRRQIPPPKPKPKLKNVEPREVEPTESSKVLHSETTVSGVKRKADVSAAASEPTALRKTAPNWSCALCQVSATNEAGLNAHLEGKKHKAKLVQCGAMKVVDEGKSGSQATAGNKNGLGPSDAPKKMCILVDEVMHEVIQKSNYLWCERCRVRCESNVTMVSHLRSKKHSKLNKFWNSMKAVRMKNKTKEDSVATCKGEKSENIPIEIPEEDKEEDTYMAKELNEDGPTEIPAEVEETIDMTGEVNENSPIQIPVGGKAEDSDIMSKSKNSPSEIPAKIKQEGTDMATDLNKKKNPIGSPAEIKKEGAEITRELYENSSIEISIGVHKETAVVATDVTEFAAKEE
ncbi:hypothetical protein ACP4OV_013480 [Aristida adscensionis]